MGRFSPFIAFLLSSLHCSFVNAIRDTFVLFIAAFALFAIHEGLLAFVADKFAGETNPGRDQHNDANTHHPEYAIICTSLLAFSVVPCTLGVAFIARILCVLVGHA